MTNTAIDNVKIDVVETKPCSITLTIEIPHPRVAQETEKAYADIQKAARVPGFRQGKAPMAMIKKSFVSAAREQVIESLVRATAFSAIQSKGVTPVDAPVIEEITFDFDKPFSFRLKAEKHPEFKVKGYTGLSIKKEVHAVTDERVKESVEALRERNARLAPSAADTVAATHFVVVDYDASENGAPLADLAARNQLVDLSSPYTLEGFKALAGAKCGEAKAITISFPADSANKKLAGKTVVFNVTVREIKEKQLPPLEDVAKEMGFASPAELEAKARESMEAEEKKRQDQDVEKQVIEKLLEANAFEVPASLVEEQFKFIKERAAGYLRSQGVPEKALADGKLDEKYRAEAEHNVRISYILNAVAAAEKIESSDADLDAELAKLLEQNKGREADVKKYFGQNREKIASRLKEEKLFAFILGKSTVTEEAKKEPKPKKEKKH